MPIIVLAHTPMNIMVVAQINAHPKNVTKRLYHFVDIISWTPFYSTSRNLKFSFKAWNFFPFFWKIKITTLKKMLVSWHTKNHMLPLHLVGFHIFPIPDPKSCVSISTRGMTTRQKGERPN